MLPLLLLLSVLALADSDKNFRIAPTMFKEGVPMQPIADMAINKQGTMILSEAPMVPLRNSIMFLRHKKGSKEYLWFSGPVDVENFQKLHAFSMADNYLKPADVMLMRFYGKQNARAFQDESDIYFDKDYIYSPRVPKLYFRKNGQWQVLQETFLPGIVTIESSVPDLQVTSLSVRLREVSRMVYPLSPGMYAFSFEAPDYLPYVDAVPAYDGSEAKLKPEMVPVDTASKVKVTTSVTLEMVKSARTLEESENLFDILTREVQSSVPLVDTNEFAKIYPPLRRALVLGVASDDSVYAAYRARYNNKREEALLVWRMSKMGSAGVVNKALRHKMDSLQAQPLQVSLVPSKIEPVYDSACSASADASAEVTDLAALAASGKSAAAKTAPTDSRGSCGLKEVRLVFGKKGERYDVSWTGNAEGFSPDSLYALLSSATAVRSFIHIEKNKPVWRYKEGVLEGRHHYRYVKMDLSVANKLLVTHGVFELPAYLLEQTEVREWLSRPVEEIPHPLSEPAPKIRREEAPMLATIDVVTHVPRVVRDRVRGNVALIDSGSFRYKGKVVSMSGFGIQTVEVTQQYFKEVMNGLDSAKKITDRSTFQGPNIPVHNITWNDARAFCQAVGGDLPTEAQWEFAGRADNNEGALWNLEEDPNPAVYAVYRLNSYGLGKGDPAYGPQPVSSKKSNEWGIFDMSGNVAEWTLDSYFMFSLWVESSNPTGALFGSDKVYKGGSWKDPEDKLNLTASYDEDPRYWSDWIGFRCAFPRDVFEGK